MRLFYVLSMLVLLFSEMFSQVLLPDDSDILHPYRQFETGGTFQNGIAFNGNTAYMSAIFDGHFYTYEFKPPATQYTDVFKLRGTDSNENVAGAMIIVGNFLYAATTFSFDRKPEIYVFDLNSISTVPIEPELTITHQDIIVAIDLANTVNSTDINANALFSFFNPVVNGDFIYWGVYHSDASGGAKILTLDISDHVTIKEEIQLFESGEPSNSINTQVQAHYTYGVAIDDDILFASTEAGIILRLTIDPATGALTENQTVLPHIDLTGAGVTHIQHLQADVTADHLWANTTLSDDPTRSSLFHIRNSTGAPITENYINTANRNINGRIYLGPNRYLYGVGESGGFRLKRDETTLAWEYDPISELNYSNIGAILGGTETGGSHFIIGENVRQKDTGLTQRRMNIVEIDAANNINYDTQTFTDLVSSSTGAKIITLSSDGAEELYASNYWIGYNYEIAADDLSDKSLLLQALNERLMSQADVITDFGIGAGDLLMGLYRGGENGNAALLYKDEGNMAPDVWITHSLPSPPSGTYDRISSITFNEADWTTYVGTSPAVNYAGIPNAAIFSITDSEISDPMGGGTFSPVTYIWNVPGLDPPDGIYALQYHNNFLYCLGYTFVTGGSEASFFSVDVGSGNVVRHNTSSNLTHHAYRSICKDDNYLLTAFGANINQILVYDLNATTIDINSPLKTLNLGGGHIFAILSDENYFYVGQRDKISVFDKKFFLQSEYDIPSSDDWYSALTLHKIDGHQVLFAGTHDGFIHRYNQSQELHTGKFTGGLQSGLISRRPNEELWLYPNLGSNTNNSLIESGFQAEWETHIGDFTGDGIDDIVTRRPDQTLWLHPWNGSGWGTIRQIGAGWQDSWELHIGDFTGDGISDIVAWRPDQKLYLYRWTGVTWGTISQIGTGWSADWELHVGDFTGDGIDDFIANRPDGKLWLYPFNGTIFDNDRTIGWGWSQDWELHTGNYNLDNLSDVVARQPNGDLWLYLWNGTNFTSSKIDAGWDTAGKVFSGKFIGWFATDSFVRKEPDGEYWLHYWDGTSWIKPVFLGNNNDIHKTDTPETYKPNGSPQVISKNQLFENYPNPFNPSTTIRYSLKNESRVKVKIFNMLGETVEVLVDDVQSEGAHNVVWDGKNSNGDTVPSGIYFYSLNTKGYHKTKKMILLK